MHLAAMDLGAVDMNGEDLVRVAPFRSRFDAEHEDGPALRWRRRVGREWARLQGRAHPEWSSKPGSGRLEHLAGIDWQQVLVERNEQRAGGTWWLPRCVVQLLDAAEHAEARWLAGVRTCRQCGAVADRPDQRRVPADDNGDWTLCEGCRTTAPRPYTGEWEGQVYAALTRKRDRLEVSEWRCAVCRNVPASVIDHCHEHGYVRVPVCASCNTRERPNFLYQNDVHLSSHYARLFRADAGDWLRHWHRCPGCRARTTLPLPHLAALTAILAGDPVRPAHRGPHSSRGAQALR